MSQLKVNSIVDASGGSNAQLYGVASPPNSMGFRNRILNGDCRIDQRNAGASVTINTLAGGYTLDRWFATGKASAGVFTVQRLSASAPAGFTNYLACTTTTSATPGATDAYVIGQFIEGFNVADLAWGSASAQAVTLSFRVYSSLTGTFGGSLANNAANRCYPFSFSIGSANTWTTISVTIPGDTTGTWTTDNTAGIKLYLDLGSGSSLRGTAGSWGSTFYTGVTGGTNVIATNGATFYITGVQLEAGTVASPFERRDYGRELMMCQRYFEIFTAAGGSSNYVNFLNGGANAATQARYVMQYSVTKRAFPSVSFTTASGFSAQKGDDSLTTCTALVAEHLGVSGCQVTATVASGFTAGANSRLITNNNTTATISISSEL